MRFVVVGLCIAAIAAPAALAKGRISVALGDSTPRVGQAFTVYVRTDYVVPANDWLRLIAVAPRKNWYDVVGAVTGDSSIAQAREQLAEKLKGLPVEIRLDAVADVLAEPRDERVSLTP